MQPVRPRSSPLVILVTALVIAAGSFVYRFNTLEGPLAGFDNDHFGQLVRAMAMLDGEQPMRDFADAELRALWPAPTYSVSAAAQRNLGRSLRSEAVLSVGMLSLGAALLFWVSTRFAGAVAPAFVCALLAVLLRPALYNYPKIVVYVLGFSAMWAYARRQSTIRLAALAAVVAAGALYRHDHGVLLAIAAAVLVVLIHGRGAMRPMMALGGICLLFMLPGFVSAQINGGLIAYLRECLAVSRQEGARTASTRVALTIDRRQRLLVHLPEQPPPLPRIAVRWAPGTSAQERERAERELGLLDPFRRTDELNWSYALADQSRRHTAAIVRDARVRDTDGIDRGTFVVTAQPPPAPPRWRRELARWRIAPGILRTDNAVAWLYGVGWVVVLGAFAYALVAGRHHARWSPHVPLALLRASTVLAVLMLLVLLRNPNPSRIADASVPVGLLSAWWMAMLSRWGQSSGRLVRSAVGVVLVVTVGLSTLAVGALYQVRPLLRTAGADSLAHTRRQWHITWQTLGTLPESLSGIDETLAASAGYLRRCTRPTDRVFIGDNLPEVQYFASRGFAAGQFGYFSNFYTSPAWQRQAIARWRRQSVPIALTQSGRRFTEEFGSDYPLLTQYLQSRYRRAGSLVVERGASMTVWVDSAVRMTTDRVTGLPCRLPG